jgi:hypothetical protein
VGRRAPSRGEALPPAIHPALGSNRFRGRDRTAGSDKTLKAIYYRNLYDLGLGEDGEPSIIEGFNGGFDDGMGFSRLFIQAVADFARSVESFAENVQTETWFELHRSATRDEPSDQFTSFLQGLRDARDWRGLVPNAQDTLVIGHGDWIDIRIELFKQERLDETLRVDYDGHRAVAARFDSAPDWRGGSLLTGEGVASSFHPGRKAPWTPLASADPEAVADWFEQELARERPTK